MTRILRHMRTSVDVGGDSGAVGGAFFRGEARGVEGGEGECSDGGDGGGEGEASGSGVREGEGSASRWQDGYGENESADEGENEHEAEHGRVVELEVRTLGDRALRRARLPTRALQGGVLRATLRGAPARVDRPP